MQRLRAEGGSIYGAVLLVLVLTGCVPATSSVTSSSLYTAPADEVFDATIRAISTSPGLDSDDSGRWRITRNDRANGLVAASAATFAWNARGRNVERVTGQVGVSIISAAADQTTVEIRASERAWELAKHIVSYLDERFGASAVSSAN